MNTPALTIEDIEAIVEKLEAEEAAKRGQLVRLIKAEARYLALRQPGKFPRRATECGDEDGHWDNSYPPKVKYKNFTGPRAIRIVKHETNDIATSSGFYHDWKRVTEAPGLYIGPRGELYGCEETGTGSVGQYAAHPGDYNVACTLEWEELSHDDISTEDLVLAEKELRTLAFPASAEQG